MKFIRKFICQMFCLLFGLLALMFFLAPMDPGDMSFSAGWALAAVCCWLVRTFYIWSERLAQPWWCRIAKRR